MTMLTNLITNSLTFMFHIKKKSTKKKSVKYIQSFYHFVYHINTILIGLWTDKAAVSSIATFLTQK